MSIEITDGNTVNTRSQFVNQGRNTLAAVKPIVVKNNDSPQGNARPYPFKDVLSRLVNVDIDMAKGKRPVRNAVRRFIGEYPRK